MLISIIKQLARTENELYLIVIGIYNKKPTNELEVELQNVFKSYSEVHKQYAKLANKDDEALKRGFFIQWIAFLEPSYLTGIDDIDQESEIKIINLIEDKIQKDLLDSEFKWMLSYYLTWDFIFDRYKEYKGLATFFANRTDDNMPSIIDKDLMKERGQMGQYWNSLYLSNN